jgi:CheY-like chemotaxis protein
LVHKSSVLIIDRSAESREVLKMALERRGMRIFEAAGAEDGLRLARQHRLDLIVLDLEGIGPSDDAPIDAVSAEIAPIATASSDTVNHASDITMAITTAAIPRTTADDFAAAIQNSAVPTPMVLLGVARRRATLPPERANQFVAKPYHYGPLILKIEQLLGKGSGVRG